MWRPYTQRAHPVWCMMSVRSNPLLQHIVFTCDVRTPNVPIQCGVWYLFVQIYCYITLFSHVTSKLLCLCCASQITAWFSYCFRFLVESSRSSLTPPLPQPVNICGLKSAHIHACRPHISWSYDKPTFNTVHFDRNPLSCSCKGRKSLNDFKFGTFTGRFPNDGAASMAVKG